MGEEDMPDVTQEFPEFFQGVEEQLAEWREMEK